MRSRFRGVVAGGAAAAMLVAAGCARDAPQDTLEPEGPAARSIDNLIMPVFGVAGIVFVFILGGCLFLAIKFRAKNDDDYDDIPEQIHGNFKLEIGWTILPALILAGVGVFTVAAIFDLSEDPSDDALKVEVIGQQWWWEYRYDTDDDGDYDDIVSANDLVIPAGREIALTVTSRDVIHSFWAPALNGKKDAVPGREHPLTIEADDPGEYLGQCTEFCGLSHAQMRIKVIALSDDDYADWEQLNEQPAPGQRPQGELAGLGYDSFTQLLCSSCHLVDGVTNEQVKAPQGIRNDPNLQVSGAAPDLTHLMSRTTFAGGMYNLRLDTPECVEQGLNWDVDECLDRPALEAWIRNPSEQKPMAPDPVPGRTGGRGMPNLNLTEQQIDQLVEYLKSLR